MRPPVREWEGGQHLGERGAPAAPAEPELSSGRGNSLCKGLEARKQGNPMAGRGEGLLESRVLGGWAVERDPVKPVISHVTSMRKA